MRCDWTLARVDLYFIRSFVELRTL